MEEEKRFILGT